jgi:hypothetical protein
MRNRSKAFFPPAVLAAVAALILMLSLFAAEKPEDAPNPLATQGLYVGDNASILGPEYVALIDGLCKRLKDATTAEMPSSPSRTSAGPRSKTSPSGFSGASGSASRARTTASWSSVPLGIGPSGSKSDTAWSRFSPTP